MKSTIAPARIELAPHECYVPLADIRTQIYEHLRTLGKDLSSPHWSCFPFCSADRLPDFHRAWPRIGDFRDGLVAGLLQTPPTDDRECARIKRVLADDIERLRQMLSEKGLDLTGEASIIANHVVDKRERELISPASLLSKSDMHDYASLEIKARIQKMTEEDIASGRLVARKIDGVDIVELDALVGWATMRGIEVIQNALPGCPPLIHASYQRLQQQLSSAPTAVGTTRIEKPCFSSEKIEEAREEKQEKKVADWIVKAREFALKYIERHRENDLFPALDDVARHLEKKLKDEKVFSEHGKPLSAAYIKRNALQGDWWQQNMMRKKTNKRSN